MQPLGLLVWNIQELSKALRIDVLSVREYFTDGRRIAFLAERRIGMEEGMRLAPSEGSAYDLKDSTGARWEVRTITKRGLFFCPSHMVGAGRKFNLEGWIDKLCKTKGFLLIDIEPFPQCRYWAVSSERVQIWWERGLLGKSTRISRDNILKMIRIL